MNKLTNILTQFSQLLVVLGSIATMLWASSEFIVDKINLHTDGVTAEKWEEHLLKDSIRVDVGITLAANMMVKLDSTTYAIHDLNQSITRLNSRIQAVELKLEPDTEITTGVQRELITLKKMIADAEEERIKTAEAQSRQIAAFQKAQEQLQPIQKGDRKP